MVVNPRKIGNTTLHDGLTRGAVVLAGGASRRMGRSKAWLDVGGRTSLSRVVAALQCSGGPIVLVGRGPQQPLPAQSADVIRVHDAAEWTGQGPLAGLQAGLAELSRCGVDVGYLSGCDAVLLDERHVAWILDRLATSSGHDATIPMSTDGRYHVLAGAVRVEVALRAVEALLVGGARSLQALANRLHTDAVPEHELPVVDVLMPCNTPAEWQAAMSGVRRAEPLE
ncbi:MAG: molybdenum cofactor guanylyltransferase [Myxococcales bacterium FL481]|nr:MAG: molybdenum cofactor guanylyltransferase [Myxococcales bacterium FL481]